MTSFNTVILEDGYGRERAIAKTVPNRGLVSCFMKFAKESESMCYPIIFVNGRGFTSVREFKDWITKANRISQEMGGDVVYN